MRWMLFNVSCNHSLKKSQIETKINALQINKKSLLKNQANKRNKKKNTKEN